MNSKERLLTAIKGGKPDRLPATTHHLMPYFLDKYLGGMSNREFFDHFGLDAIHLDLAAPPRPATRASTTTRRRASWAFWKAAGSPATTGASRPRTLPDPKYKTTRYTFHHARGHSHHGAAVQRAHRLGHRAPDQGEEGHRPDRRVRDGAQVRRRGRQPAADGVRRARASCAATSAASTSSASRAAGRTPAAWSASSA